MSKLKSIILQLQNDEYEGIKSQLERTGAEKFLKLFVIYREQNYRDSKIKEELKVNDSAYYTLKSRLLDKVQNFLSNRFSINSTDVLHKVEDIPDLLYTMNRRKAITILHKLEQDIQIHDSPYKLASVYDALKKLHMHTPKYYEYTQLYNRHIAYTIAMDKAGDLLMDFFRKLADWHFNRDATTLQVLSLLQQELYHVGKLYESHHMAMYRCLMDSAYMLILPIEKKAGVEESVEDLIARMQEILAKNPHDKLYAHLKLAYHFIAFDNDRKNGNLHDAEVHFKELDKNLSTFLLYNHCSYPTMFLKRKLERAFKNNLEAKLYDETIELLKEFEPDRDDKPNYYNFMLYRAAASFYAQHYQEATGVLVRMMNDISFKNSPRAELEARLFLTLCYILSEDIDLAQSHLRSVARKLRELEDVGSFENARLFYKLLLSFTGSREKQNKEKLLSMIIRFDIENQNEDPILVFIKTGESLYKLLEKVKN
ncbi:MAG: hypothetical protein HYZ42_16560 [Bacteroidetes bacterium]|nr:hypothetical protein [Bacteroidota bacterium]